MLDPLRQSIKSDYIALQRAMDMIRPNGDELVPGLDEHHVSQIFIGVLLEKAEPIHVILQKIEQLPSGAIFISRLPIKVEDFKTLINSTKERALLIYETPDQKKILFGSIGSGYNNAGIAQVDTPVVALPNIHGHSHPVNSKAIFSFVDTGNVNSHPYPSFVVCLINNSIHLQTGKKDSEPISYKGDFYSIPELQKMGIVEFCMQEI